jgi:hypothetical protein
MELRTKGVIGLDQGGHTILELENGEGAQKIRSHVGEEVELVIVTRERSATLQDTSPQWNVEDQQ